MSLLLQCRQLGNADGTKPLFTRVDLSIKPNTVLKQVRAECTGTHTLKIRRPE